MGFAKVENGGIFPLALRDYRNRDEILPSVTCRVTSFETKSRGKWLNKLSSATAPIRLHLLFIICSQNLELAILLRF